MKVAFVGKGGSGKSTTSSLFILSLLEKKKKLLAIDADLNIHIPELLHIPLNENKALSMGVNMKKIREYLKGNNSRIKDVKEFYKTTPPAQGSQFLTLKDTNPLIQTFAEKMGSTGYFMYVGTYEEDGIGTSCYHTNLSICENLLSHAILGQDEWIVTDMVAGIDAFSNSLHLQFDVLFLVVEPTLESIQVYKQYKQLATHAGVFDRLYVVGNKIEEEADKDFIKKHIESEKIVGFFKKNTEIKKLRQNGLALTVHALSQEEKEYLQKMAALAVNKKQNENMIIKKLQELHLRYINQDYVKNAVGDISHQIDPDFIFPTE